MRIRKLLCLLLRCPKKKTASQKVVAEEAVPESVVQKEFVTLQHKNAVEFGKFSLELEEKRGESLITHSGHMLTAFSLYSAALLTLLAALLNDGFISRTHLYMASTGIAFPLVFSLVFTMLAHWRYKYEILIDGEAFRKIFSNESEFYREQYQFDYQFIYQLQLVQKSMETVNDKRLKYIKAAMLCFFVSIAMLFIFYVILSFLYTRGG